MSETEFELKTAGPWSCFAFPALEQRGIAHGFMTKTSDPICSDPGQQESFVRSLGAERLVIMDQEHGKRVHLIEKGERPQMGDGLIMVEKGVIGVIKTADCLPVILYSLDSPVAAVVHAGWRGTVKGITREALLGMKKMGIPPERMGALIGPGIGPCCYEVQEDVVSEFCWAGFGSGIITQRGSSTFLDLKKANREIIEDEGVSEIHDIDLCTACRPDLFWSARRDKNGRRQISFVLIKKDSVK